MPEKKKNKRKGKQAQDEVEDFVSNAHEKGRWERMWVFG